MLLSHHDLIFPFLHYTATPHSYSTSPTPGQQVTLGTKSYFKGLEMNSFTQTVYNTGRLWTKLKDAVFKTTFVWVPVGDPGV